MILLDGIEGFEWDDANASKSFVKHDVSQQEIEQVFVNAPLLFFEDDKHSQSERRFHVYGKTHTSRLLQVSFTLRNSEKLIRVISARPMSKKERERYAQEV
jgi:hypothetical protein